MPLSYVTGLSGTGKSAVLRELRRRGYRAAGVDEDGYADWIDLRSGQVDERRGDLAAWVRTHRWVLSVERIGALSRAVRAGGGTVFLCGCADRDDLVWQLFDRVVALVADPGTLRRRIAERTDNGYGKDPAQLAAILRWHDGYEARYRRYGAAIVDATRPLAAVVDDVLACAVCG